MQPDAQNMEARKPSERGRESRIRSDEDHAGRTAGGAGKWDDPRGTDSTDRGADCSASEDNRTIGAQLAQAADQIAQAEQVIVQKEQELAGG